MMEQINPVFTQKIGFQYRNNSISVSFESSDYLNFDANFKINDFSIKFSSTCIEFSVETMMEKVKPVVAEKSEDGNGGEPKLVAYFGVFGLSRFSGKKKNNFSFEYFFTGLQFSNDTLVE